MVVESTQCRQCGDVFEQSGRGCPRIWCVRCRPPAPPVDAETLRVNAERRKQQTCAHCGREFTGRLRKYCERRCYVAAATARNLERYGVYRKRRIPRTCELCGAEYLPSYGGQRTCGRECGVVLASNTRAARRKDG